jgi:HlyD family secretion protein
MLLLAAAVLGWAFLGSIATEVPALGILVSEGGRVVGAMAPTAGVVEELDVRPGDMVTQGQVLAKLVQPGLLLQLEQARALADEAKEDMESGRVALNQNLEKFDAALHHRRETFLEAARLAEARAARMQAQLVIREQLRRENLTPEERVEQARADLAKALQDAGEARAQITELGTARLQLRQEADKDLREMAAEIVKTEREVKRLEQELQNSSEIVAPADGRITEVMALRGERVQANQVVVNLETAGQRLQAVVYVPTEHGKKLAEGQPVRLMLANLDAAEWGWLHGRLSGFSSFPSSPEGMTAVLQNAQLVRGFGGHSPPFEARVDLQAAATTSGYAWSSGDGPPMALTSGSTLRAAILVQQDVPVDLILPGLRRAWGQAAVQWQRLQRWMQ